MANESEQLVQNYAVDINRLSKEVQRLQEKEKNLRAEQDKLNTEFKEGKIEEKEYTKAIKENEKALKDNHNEAKNLAKAVTEVSNTQQDMGKVFGKVSGMLVSSIGGIINALDQWRQKQNAAREEAKKMAEAAALEKVQKQYDWLFNTEDEHIKNLEKMMKRQQAAGESTEEYEKSKAKAIEDQLANAKRMTEELNKQLEIDQKAAKESYTRFQGTTAAKRMEQANLQVKKTQEAIKKTTERIETLNKLQSNYEEELLLKRLANNKKVKDDEEAAAKKRREARLKEIDEQAKLEEELRKRIEDLNVLSIEDEKEQKIAKIKLEEKRALESLDKQYKTASENNKKLINQVKDLTKNYTQIQINALNNKDVTDSLNEAVKRMQKFLAEYTKTLASEFERATMADSEIFEKYFKNIYKHIFEEGEEGYKKMLTAMQEANRKAFDDSLTEQIFDPDVLIEYKKALGNLTDLQKAELDLEAKLAKIKSDESKNETKINEEYEKRVKSTKELYALEIKRFNEAREKTQQDPNQEYDAASWDTTYAELISRQQEDLTALNEWKLEQNRLLNEQMNMQNQIAEKEAIDAKTELYKGYVENVGSMLGSLGEIFGSLADLEEEGSQKALSLQRAQAYMNIALSIAEGTSKAISSSSNWIEAIAAIASMTAAVVAQVVTIKKYEAQADKAKSQKYATGGYVQGPGSGTSDSINAKLSNGEFVVNAQSTAANLGLLQAINNSNGSALIGKANSNAAFIRQLAVAMSNVRPIVTVESIDRQRDVVAQVDVLSKL